LGTSETRGAARRRDRTVPDFAGAQSGLRLPTVCVISATAAL